MERLTQRYKVTSGNGVTRTFTKYGMCQDCEVIERHADYEDTGLSPEQVRSIVRFGYTEDQIKNVIAMLTKLLELIDDSRNEKNQNIQNKTSGNA